MLSNEVVQLLHVFDRHGLIKDVHGLWFQAAEFGEPTEVFVVMRRDMEATLDELLLQPVRALQPLEIADDGPFVRRKTVDFVDLIVVREVQNERQRKNTSVRLVAKRGQEHG